LRTDPLIAPLVAAAPGRRVPGAADSFEIAVRAVLGQQVSVAGARTLAGRFVTAYGEPLARPIGGVTHVFPTADAIAAADPSRWPLPQARRRALCALADAIAAGTVDLRADGRRADARQADGRRADAVRDALLALPG